MMQNLEERKNDSTSYSIVNKKKSPRGPPSDKIRMNSQHVTIHGAPKKPISARMFWVSILEGSPNVSSHPTPPVYYTVAYDSAGILALLTISSVYTKCIIVRHISTQATEWTRDR